MGALGSAHRVLISPVHRAESYSDEVRMDTESMALTLSEQCVSALACHSKEGLFAELENLPDEVARLVILFTNGSFGKPLADYLAKLRSR